MSNPNKEYNEGYRAYASGARCPYMPGTDECYEWQEGHAQAYDDSMYEDMPDQDFI